MMAFDPSDDIFSQLSRKGGQFLRLLWTHLSRGVVFCGVSLGAAGIEVVGVRLTIGPEDQREGLQRAVMREAFLRPPAFGVDEYGAELECAL